MRVDDLADAHLADLDAARQARARVAVQDGSAADALAAGLEQRILLGVDAQARRETDARRVAAVAARTAALGAVAQAPRRAVVPRRHHALALPDEHAPDAPLHAVAAVRGQRGQRHKVRVPPGPQPLRVREVQLAERRVQVRQRRRRVDEAHRRARDERLQALLRAVQMLVAGRGKGLEGERRGRVVVAAGRLDARRVAPPAHEQRRVGRDEHEKGAP
ncbi:hypothetical protein BBAD15_g7272 [Beauveria bassiana D1-5]|uniref:Uncharacterized protein n=1 Tax=Beauveria bassiana D1-5 TaxID=1245745 RepID=A0A0A2VIG2_BEABA|nr:hypothetical protein BBAD15_g7272 [Beauveria bassiana D1-5]